MPCSSWVCAAVVVHTGWPQDREAGHEQPIRSSDLAAPLLPSLLMSRPSAALLDILSGRKTDRRGVSGEILYSGNKPSPQFLRRFTGYVEQRGECQDKSAAASLVMMLQPRWGAPAGGSQAPVPAPVPGWGGAAG